MYLQSFFITTVFWWVSFSIIWLLQVLSINGLTQILRYEITVRNDVFWLHTRPSFSRINVAASLLSLFPFLFSLQPKKHQTVQWSPMVTATSASEAQRRRAVPKTLSPVQTADAQVGLRWRGWMAGGRRSTADEIFNFGNTHLVSNKQRKLSCYNSQNGRTIPVGFCVCFSLLQICFIYLTFILFLFGKAYKVLIGKEKRLTLCKHREMWVQKCLPGISSVDKTQKANINLSLLKVCIV